VLVIRDHRTNRLDGRVDLYFKIVSVRSAYELDVCLFYVTGVGRETEAESEDGDCDLG
jgi:hypothetical protein